MISLFKQARLSKVKIALLVIFILLQMLGTLYLPNLTADIINNGVLRADRDYVISTGLLMLLVAVLTGVFSILSTYFSSEIATRFSRNIRNRLFKHTQKLSYQDYKVYSTGSLITRATNDVEQIQGAIGMFFEMIIPAPFVVVVGMILSLMRDTVMGLIIFVSTLIFGMAFGLVSTKVLPLFAQTQKGLDKVNSIVSQYLSGIRVVRAFNRTKLEKDKMDESFQSLARINIRINRLFAMVMPLVMFVMSLTTVAILWFGGVRIDSGHMEIGDIMAVIEYSMNILFYLLMAVFALIFIPRAKVSAERINEVLHKEPEIADGEENTVLPAIEEVTFHNVSFSYKDAENPVLQDLNFTCKQGTTTAIIGGTGSGKSTLARLIPRLLDVSGGKITMNGIDVNDMSQESLRANIGFVAQKAHLFGGTIESNLLSGNPAATAEELEFALQTACAADFVNALPERLEAKVNQGGSNFSGGQRQRLSIARMLVKKPGIYIFDDSFSALDYKTDAMIRQSLKEYTADAIFINIAQRITTIKDAEQIIVIDEGRIVGKGTHKELLSTCEIYLDIAKSQLSEEELANELR